MAREEQDQPGDVVEARARVAPVGVLAQLVVGSEDALGDEAPVGRERRLGLPRVVDAAAAQGLLDQ